MGRTKNITVPPSQGFKKKVQKEIFILPRIDKKKGKDRIVNPEIVSDMNKIIKKKKESGKKDIVDRIGDILSVPYKIRGGKKGLAVTKRPKRGGGPDWINTHEPGPMGNPPVIEKIDNMREFHIANPGIEDVADYSEIYGKPKKKSKKSKKANGGFVSVSEYVEDII